MLKSRKIKGFSLPSVIVGSIIASVLGTIVVSSMWTSVEKSKVSAVAGTITNLQEALTSQRWDVFSNLKAVNSAQTYDNKVQDYLPELEALGVADNSGFKEMFREPEALSFEIRLLAPGKDNLFYIFMDSTNPIDKEVLELAVESLGKGIEDVQL